MLGFLSMLIYWKWFSEINIYFLQPGHTHEDIDQMFSTLSLWLDTNSIGSIPSLISNLPKAWNKSPSYRPEIKCFPAYMNWSQWLAPHLKDFSGHGNSYAFIFRLQSNRRPGMKMKTLCTIQVMARNISRANTMDRFVYNHSNWISFIINARFY